MNDQATPAAPLLSLRGISVRFGSVRALDGVDLDLAAGEIRAVLGENGAGKSTLMNFVYGLAGGEGEIRWHGRPVVIDRPAAARRLGIGMVHQEFSLIDALTVAENLAVAAGGGSVLLDLPAVAALAARRARDIGLDIGDLDARTGDLPVGVRQRIEILKALLGEVRLLILDEPTAVLTPGETDQLFAVLRTLRQRGVAILLITHKLREVMALSDTVTVLRRGRVVAQRSTATASESELAELMVGRTAPPRIFTEVIPAADTPPVLRASAVSLRDRGDVLRLDRLDLEVAAGEIFGIAGVDGNGQMELFELLTGLRRPDAGAIEIGGAAPGGSAPSVIPPDRRDGAIPAMSIWENTLLDGELLQRHSPGGRLDRRAAQSFAAALVERHGVVCDGVQAPAASLSGGNLQKLIVGRALARRPRLLVAFNPTRGLDVGAAGHVHAALREVLGWDGAVLLLSTDLDEVMAVSDCLAVLFRGRIGPPLRRPFDRAAIGRMLAGGNPNPSAA